MKKFVTLYVLYLAIAFFLVDFEPMRKALHIESFYNSFIASLSAFFIHMLGIVVTATNDTLHLPHADMIIKFGCNGLEAVLIYLAGVFAYPAKSKLKIIYGIFGTIILEVINIARIALLAWTIEHYPKYFELMHTYLTQSIMIVLAFLAFLFYLQRVSDEKPSA
ncbi:archaeosortase/exosortase family protein [Nitratiruptor tergarcus]|uniref:Exosortase/archaeosortase family protein n=1 Tax=Nitratiruptor tergarcus DSM 16512 TaxID=1069081 RepID=A0A1W1WQU0_9BACT|nr:archaeosortase/exosortase family protein [Nitratiruptor tergarcus]SMC08671.1 exosortase/archaeosortase family protein [Nitratiruptor tergarcus DSM 16512]